MNRRIIISAFVLVIATSVIIGFFTLRHATSGAANPIRAIPVDAAFILRINNFYGLDNSLFKNSKLWSALGNLDGIARLDSDIHYLDSIGGVKDNLDQIAFKSTLYLSGHHFGGNRNDYLFIINPSGTVSPRGLIESLTSITDQDIKNTVRKYEGTSIYTIKLNENEKPENLYLSVDEGNLFISKSVILIENAIRQLSLPTSLLDDPGFSEAYKTTGKNKNANLYINFRKITLISSQFISNDWQNHWKNYQSFGGWAELDINNTDTSLILNGFIVTNNPEERFLDIFKGSSPVKITCDQVLPASIAAFASFAIDDPTKMNETFSSYLTVSGSSSNRSMRLKQFQSDFGVDPVSYFSRIIDDEITVAQGVSENSSEGPSTYILVKCKSGGQAKKEIVELAEKIAHKKKISTTQLKHNYQLDSDTRFDIMQFPYENITGLLFGSLFDLKGKTYFAVLDNYMIFGESVESLGQLLYSNVLSRTLSTNEMYRTFSQDISQKSYLLFYTNLARSSMVFSKYLDPEIVRKWDNKFDVFQKVQPFGIQISEVSKLLYCNMSLGYVDTFKGKPQTVWESLLDTTFDFKPQFVENYITKQNEIFLQDKSNEIYLINKAGRILWKEKIAEQINSPVYQIDYYKNGKLQMLFSTPHYLHLIDRNGNYVEHYPIRLRSEATAGMSVFDYDNNKNYRIFIPCKDKNVYVYSKEGTIVPGWKFPGSDYPVYQPVNYFKIGQKDYIVFGDKYRTYILDRRGNIRVPVEKMIVKSKNNNYAFEDNGTPENSRIVITDTLGTIYSIYFDGRVESNSVGIFSPDHLFDFKDVDGDGERDYIFLDDNTLSVYRQDRSKMWSYTFPHKITEIPIYFRFSASDRKLGIVDKTDQKIYLINNDGTVYKGFPLEGSTLFSIGYLEFTEGTFNLIVGGRNNFLYNYSVQ